MIRRMVSCLVGWLSRRREDVNFFADSILAAAVNDYAKRGRFDDLPTPLKEWCDRLPQQGTRMPPGVRRQVIRTR